MEAVWDVLRAEARALERAADHVGPAFGEVLDLLQRCTGRVVVAGIGRSGQVAQCMASTLNRAGVPSLFLHAADAAHGDLGAVTSSDVALLVSHDGATQELLLLLPYLGELKVPIVALVGDERSALARAASHVLSTQSIRHATSPEIAEMASALVSLALVDALAAGLRHVTGA